MTAPTSKNDELVKSWRHFMATRELPTGWEIGDEHAYARETAAKLADALEAAERETHAAEELLVRWTNCYPDYHRWGRLAADTDEHLKAREEKRGDTHAKKD